MLVFNAVIQGVRELEPGGIAYLEHSILDPVEKAVAPFWKINRNKISEGEKMTKEDIGQFFQFFIGTHRSLFQDVYYREIANDFLFICKKK